MNADSKQSNAIKGKEKVLTDSCVGIDKERKIKATLNSDILPNRDRGLRDYDTTNIEKDSIAAWHWAVQRERMMLALV